MSSGSYTQLKASKYTQEGGAELGSTHRGWRRTVIFLGIVLLVASGLEACVWNSRPFWIDAPAYAYCVRVGRPIAHPPGYLLFIGLGRLIYAAFGCSPFQAVQAISFFSYLGSIPLMFQAVRRVTAFRPAAVLTVTYAFSWTPLLVATVGTSHATDLLFGAAILAVATLPAFAAGETMALAGFFGLLILTSGFRLSTAVMWSPAVLAVLWSHRRRPAAWIGAISLAVAVTVFTAITAHFYGGWNIYRATTQNLNRSNAASSLLNCGFTRSAMFNSGRAILWLIVQGSWAWALAACAVFRAQIPATLRAGWQVAVFSVAGVAFVLTFYLDVHPGYMAPLVPGIMLLTAIGWERLRHASREPLAWKLVSLSVLTTLALFFGLQPVWLPRTARAAVADSLLLQYTYSGMRTATFCTTTEWLVRAGQQNAAPIERVEDVESLRQQGAVR